MASLIAPIEVLIFSSTLVVARSKVALMVGLCWWRYFVDFLGSYTPARLGALPGFLRLQLIY